MSEAGRDFHEIPDFSLSDAKGPRRQGRSTDTRRPGAPSYASRNAHARYGRWEQKIKSAGRECRSSQWETKATVHQSFYYMEQNQAPPKHAANSGRDSIEL